MTSTLYPSTQNLLKRAAELGYSKVNVSGEIITFEEFESQYKHDFYCLNDDGMISHLEGGFEWFEDIKFIKEG